MGVLDPIAVFPQSPAPELARTLDLAGYSWKGVGGPDAIAAGSWSGAVIACDADPDTAWAVCRAMRARGGTLPILVLVSGGQLGDLDVRGELFEDFCLSPFHPAEAEARLRHLFLRAVPGEGAELAQYGELVLNVDTYQASVSGRPLDLTYMEYELLKFLVHNPGKVFTRETLLSRVWGYEYYGGARTVDVHIRRLRAKLGEEHASLIHTVRSVGYRFGQGRWG